MLALFAALGFFFSFELIGSTSVEADRRPMMMTSKDYVCELSFVHDSFVRAANGFVMSQCEDYVNGSTNPIRAARPRDEKKCLIPLVCMNTSSPLRGLLTVYCFVC